MVKYENEFGEVKREKRTTFYVSEPVYTDLESLRLYPDEPFDKVIERLMKSMDAREMAEEIAKDLKESHARLSGTWKEQVPQNYMRFYRKDMGPKERILRLYDEALDEQNR